MSSVVALGTKLSEILSARTLVEDETGFVELFIFKFFVKFVVELS